MGCAQSTASVAVEVAGHRARWSKESPISNTSSISTRCTSEDSPRRLESGKSNASEMSEHQRGIQHQRLRKLLELDAQTKIPFILVELRGHANHDGYIEVCGKDEYGVYCALGEWLASKWRCQKLDAADLSEDTPVPFSDALFRWTGFLTDENTGTNNMGLSTMQLVDFMCGTLSWTLGVINGGNVGIKGEIREQQIIFKAPHPMNLASQHVMIELRSAGFVEICGNNRSAKDVLHKYFVEQMGATALRGRQNYSDRYYKCRDGIFKERGRNGENNLGLLTAKVCDAVVKLLPGWSLVTMNGGNYGDNGMHREQQLVFRWDNHPLRENPHLLVEMREAGFVEICGQDVDGIYKNLDRWLRQTWGCHDAPNKWGQEPFYDRKLIWTPMDMMVASAELAEFFHQQGWQMQVCSQGTVALNGTSESREQQILFRPGASGMGVVEPHIFIELYTGEGDDALYAQQDKTQVLGNQHIRIHPVGNCYDAVVKLKAFLQDYLGASELLEKDVITFACDVFLSRGLTDNNLGCWTMRLCDFMVDRLGWSFVVCNVCNLGPCGIFREQQLVFRFDGERREIPAVKDPNIRLDEVEFIGLDFPSYWKCSQVLSLSRVQETSSCVPEEIDALQEIFDHTFKRVLTRDRVYEYQLGVSEEMPYRLEVVHAFRSEHAELFRRYNDRRATYQGGEVVRPKSRDAGALLNIRIADGEALLFHGTNPSSAMGILKSGFVLNHAGKATGTMFGYGVYLAECVSKSDEYARDDNGGTYPGLMAMLVCRTLIGKPHIVHDAGDHVSEARALKCDCVLGDRESKVGTYREFIFWDERQVIPEYTVIYRRQYNDTKVPKLMRQSTRGTTGKNWQVQVEKGWANMPPDVSYELNDAQAAGNFTIQREINDTYYEFDLASMRQKNLGTGAVRKIRPPMRR